MSQSQPTLTKGKAYSQRKPLRSPPKNKNQAKKFKRERRNNLVSEISLWISSQPEQRVRLSDVKKRVIEYGMINSLISNEFVCYPLDGEEWISSRSHVRQLLAKEALEWISSLLDGKVIKTALDAWVSGRGFPVDFLPLDPNILFQEDKATWVQHKQRFIQNYQEILQPKFENAPDHMVTEQAFLGWAGGKNNAEIFFSKKIYRTVLIGETLWVFPAEQDTPEFRKIIDKKQAAFEAEKKEQYNQQWKAYASRCGEVMRPGASKAQTPRLYVIARSYTETTAAKRLSFPTAVIRDFVQKTPGTSFVDPDGRLRIPAHLVESIAADEAEWERVAKFIPLRTRHISLVADISYEAVRYRLKKAGLSTVDATWGEVCGMWGLPSTYKEFGFSPD